MDEYLVERALEIYQ